MIRFAISTLGCKVNTYETEGYIQALLDKGYEEVSFKEEADIYIINTCAVTNMAASKSRKMIHQAHARNVHALIVVVGCYVQTYSDQLKEHDYIDILVGSDGKKELPDLIENAIENKTHHNTVHDVRSVKAFEALPISRFHHQTRAFLKIQDGCNQFCSYCIIPYARGAERSLPIDEVLTIARNLVANGHLEIVLSGIHTGRYGNDQNTTLFELLKRMTMEVNGLARIRISSIEMNEISDDLLDLMKCEPKIARHLHIPIQSGCDSVLKNMNRPYTVEELKQRIAHIHSLLPGISISSDVIVGFPMESDDDFETTVATIESMKLSFLHVFPYSKRDHTVAAAMPGHIEQKVKKERAAKLASLSQKLYNDYKQTFIGNDVQVIFERSQGDFLLGHTSEYVPVKVKGNSNLLHQMRSVHVVSYEEDHLIAQLEEV